MTPRVIKSKQPKCITCGRLLDEWNPFVLDEHQEHAECTGKRIAGKMMEGIKKDLMINQ